MKLIMISGDGQGAGKTFLARKLTDNQTQIFSIVNIIRQELQKKYSQYDWFNKEPEYKRLTMVEKTGKSILQHLDELGRGKKKEDPLHWSKKMIEILKYARDFEQHDTIVIDDIRFVDEYEHLKNALRSENILHIHVANQKAKPEPHYENEKLRLLADYIIVSQKQLSSLTGVQ
jgi:hypothetical protein